MMSIFKRYFLSLLFVLAVCMGCDNTSDTPTTSVPARTAGVGSEYVFEGTIVDAQGQLENIDTVSLVLTSTNATFKGVTNVVSFAPSITSPATWFFSTMESNDVQWTLADDDYYWIKLATISKEPLTTTNNKTIATEPSLWTRRTTTISAFKGMESVMISGETYEGYKVLMNEITEDTRDGVTDTDTTVLECTYLYELACFSRFVITESSGRTVSNRMISATVL